jgi:hypothetical protein
VPSVLQEESVFFRVLELAVAYEPVRTLRRVQFSIGRRIVSDSKGFGGRL